MMRTGTLAILAAALSLVGCGSDAAPGSAEDYRAFVGRELARWRRDFPAYSKAAKIEIEVVQPDPASAVRIGSATYQAAVRGEVAKDQEMTVIYRFEARHAYEDGKWVFQAGRASAAKIEIVPKDELTEDFIRHRMQEGPTPIDGIATADPAGAR